MKKTKLLTVLAVVLLSTVVVSGIVAGTYARYASTVTGSATATAANWAFEAGMANGGQTVTTIDLYNTIPNAATTYPNLKAGTIAPGTSGSFQIVVDGTGSEVGIDYTVALIGHEGTTLPTGLTITPADLNGTIPYSAEADAMKKTTTVNWEWVLGDDATATTGLDNEYADDETYQIDVTIKGTQHIGTIVED